MRHALRLCSTLLAALVPAAAAQDNGFRYEERVDDPPAPFRAIDDPAARSQGMRLSIGGATSVQVNVDANGMNITGDAANESSIAVDPTNPERIVIGWRQFDNVSSNFRQAGNAYSTDGGESWTNLPPLEAGIFRSDPVLGFDNDGRVYYQSLDGSIANMQVFESADAGQSWGAPVPSFGGDKNWLAVDTSGGVGDGNLYGIWQRFFGCCGNSTFTRSTDGNVSWQPPVEVAFFPIFGTLAVGPDGEVYACGVDGTFGQDFETFVFAKSTNAQNAGQMPTFTGGIVDMGGPMRFATGPNPGGLLAQVNVAVDRSGGAGHGNVYIVGCSNPDGSDPNDVVFIRSEDGGASWTAPLRINGGPHGSDRWQWFAAHDVAPNGRIDVVWYDTRNSGDERISELFYAWSYDEGASWQGDQPVSAPFDSHVGWPNQNKLGDYITIVSLENGAHVSYSATFNGEQDVYYARLYPECTTSGVGSAFCFGDGSGTACPCANTGAPGHGCGNSFDAAGVQLSACGVASVSDGNLQLFATGGVPNQTALWFQGDVALNGGMGAPFRDGLRCTGSPTARLEVSGFDFAGSGQSTVALGPTGNVAAGETKHYQLWYRDPSGSPCGTGSNLSNGTMIVWAP